MNWTLTALEETYPWVAWREPIAMSGPGVVATRYACRVCIANHGITGEDVVDLPTEADDVRRHIEAEHC